ncbi:ORF1R [black bullhead herpesvirus]|uniref:ORF1L n=1 Tax=black bullhead herpesvirus TaxID=508441 RepID=A0A2H5AJE5_9VIRU|nr:ORF1L [black bullhead herpesvirus]YP_009447905.1 ORF1R [black bullhead herpesvirus]AUG72257.1 ORF1L [black bullhead herpesvirus]AUG72327.1 ORF1R [black bullhead herpesvirus]
MQHSLDELDMAITNIPQPTFGGGFAEFFGELSYDPNAPAFNAQEYQHQEVMEYQPTPIAQLQVQQNTFTAEAPAEVLTEAPAVADVAMVEAPVGAEAGAEEDQEAIERRERKRAQRRARAAAAREAKEEAERKAREEAEKAKEESEEEEDSEEESEEESDDEEAEEESGGEETEEETGASAEEGFEAEPQVPNAIPLCETVRGFSAEVRRKLPPGKEISSDFKKHARTLFGVVLPPLANIVEQKGAVDSGSSDGKTLVALIAGELGTMLGKVTGTGDPQLNRMAAQMLLLKTISKSAFPPLTKVGEGVFGALEHELGGTGRKIQVATHAPINKFLIIRESTPIPRLGWDKLAPVMKYYDPQHKVTSIVLLKGLKETGYQNVTKVIKGVKEVRRERIPIQAYMFRAFVTDRPRDAIIKVIDVVKALLSGIGVTFSYVLMSDSVELTHNDFLRSADGNMMFGEGKSAQRLSFRKPVNMVFQPYFRRWGLINTWIKNGGRIRLSKESTLKKKQEAEIVEREAQSGEIKSLASLMWLANRTWSSKNIIRVNGAPALTPTILHEIPDFVHKGDVTPIILLMAASLKLDIALIHTWLTPEKPRPTKPMEVAKLTMFQFLFLKLLLDSGLVPAGKTIGHVLATTNTWLRTELLFFTFYEKEFKCKPENLSGINNELPVLPILSWIGDIPQHAAPGIVGKVRAVFENHRVINKMQLHASLENVERTEKARAKVRQLYREEKEERSGASGGAKGEEKPKKAAPKKKVETPKTETPETETPKKAAPKRKAPTSDTPTTSTEVAPPPAKKRAPKTKVTPPAAPAKVTPPKVKPSTSQPTPTPKQAKKVVEPEMRKSGEPKKYKSKEFIETSDSEDEQPKKKTKAIEKSRKSSDKVCKSKPSLKTNDADSDDDEGVVTPAKPVKHHSSGKAFLGTGAGHLKKTGAILLPK